MNDTTIDQEPGLRVSAAELAATREKFAKIAARATKRGFTGGLELEVTGPFEETHVGEFTGIETTEVFYRVKVTGSAPSYGGWTFLGRVEATDSGKPIIFLAPGVDEADFTGVRPGECDHCGHNRRRKTTVLVANTETGERKNVGTTCLKDFLGWSANPVLIWADDVNDQMDSWGREHWSPSWTPETVVAVAWAATKAFGYVRSGFDGSTVGIVRSALHPITKADREIAAKLRPLADEATERAGIVLDFIRSDEFSGPSTYVSNLKSLVDEQYVTGQYLGFLASAPQAYLRHLETADERAAKQAQWDAEKAAKASSQWFGTAKDKVTLDVTIVSIRWVENNYTGGSKPKYTLRTAEGNLVTWWASSAALGEDNEGTQMKVVATVKDHEEWQGQKSTIVTHVKMINPATGKPFSARATNQHSESEWNEEAKRYTGLHTNEAHPDCQYCAAQVDEN